MSKADKFHLRAAKRALADPGTSTWHRERAEGVLRKAEEEKRRRERAREAETVLGPQPQRADFATEGAFTAALERFSNGLRYLDLQRLATDAAAQPGTRKRARGEMQRLRGNLPERLGEALRGQATAGDESPAGDGDPLAEEFLQSLPSPGSGDATTGAAEPLGWPPEPLPVANPVARPEAPAAKIAPKPARACACGAAHAFLCTCPGPRVVEDWLSTRGSGFMNDDRIVAASIRKQGGT